MAHTSGLRVGVFGLTVPRVLSAERIDGDQSGLSLGAGGPDPSAESKWVPHTSGLRVGVLISLLPGLYPPKGSIVTNPASPLT